MLARQPSVKASGFTLSPGRTPPRRVKRLGRDYREKADQLRNQIKTAKERARK